MGRFIKSTVMKVGEYTAQIPRASENERPPNPVDGQLFFNTSTNMLEVFRLTQWERAAVAGNTVIEKDSFTGDASTIVFSPMSYYYYPFDANQVLVFIDNVYQEPDVAYTIEENEITFTQIPSFGVDIVILHGLGSTGLTVAASAASLKSFYAPLKTTLVPSISSGSPTFTRANLASITDHENRILTVAANETRFTGVRRVENLLTDSEDLNDVSWFKTSSGTGSAPAVTSGFTAPDATSTAWRVELDKGAGSTGADHSYIRGNVTSQIDHGYVRSVWMKSNTGGDQIVRLNGSDAPPTYKEVEITTAWQQFGILLPNCIVADTVQTSLEILTRGDLGTTQSVDILIWHPQVEDVSGSINQSPSEYVSAEVTSWPYHGAGVDRVQYFDTENPNTVSNVYVTESIKSSITENTLSWADLSGVAGSYLLTPNAAVLNFPGDLEIVMLVAPNKWDPPGVVEAFVYRGGAAFFSYRTSGTGGLVHYGSTGTNSINTQSTAGMLAAGAGRGEAKWLRIKHDVDNGASGQTVQFFYSGYDGSRDVPASWTQLGANVVLANIHTRVGGVADIAIGSHINGTSFPFPGKFGRFMLYDGFSDEDGTLVADFNINDGVVGNSSVTSSTTGEVWSSVGQIQFLTRPLQGLRIDPERENLFLESEDFGNTWAAVGANVTTNTAVAPDGTWTADEIIESATASQHRFYQLPGKANASTYTVSIYAKANTRTRIGLGISNDGVDAKFDLANGVVISSTGYSDATITHIRNNWYRCTATKIYDSALNDHTGLYMVNDSDLSNYTGDGTSSFYVWAAQVELGDFPTSYIRTGGTTITRPVDEYYILATDNIYNDEGTGYAEYAFSHTGVGAGSSRIIGDYPSGNAAPIFFGGNSTPALSTDGVTTTTKPTISPVVAPDSLIKGAGIWHTDLRIHKSITQGNVGVEKEYNGTTISGNIAVGAGGGASFHFSGVIRGVRIWDQMINDDDLIVLTTVS